MSVVPLNILSLPPLPKELYDAKKKPEYQRFCLKKYQNNIVKKIEEMAELRIIK